MQYGEFVKIQRIKKMLDIIAYGSVALDMGIAIVTLISFHANISQLSDIEYFLNVSLTVEVIVVLVLMCTMMLLYKYQKIIYDLATVSKAITGRKGKKGTHKQNVLAI
ncbi:Uncharacterised protein [uncultured archaeon]|nr:Uncharacterised protein [uncultured archaeon]